MYSYFASHEEVWTNDAGQRTMSPSDWTEVYKYILEQTRIYPDCFWMAVYDHKLGVYWPIPIYECHTGQLITVLGVDHVRKTSDSE